jgi:hypothetical protein
MRPRRDDCHDIQSDDVPSGVGTFANAGHVYSCARWALSKRDPDGVIEISRARFRSWFEYPNLQFTGFAVLFLLGCGTERLAQLVMHGHLADQAGLFEPIDVAAPRRGGYASTAIKSALKGPFDVNWAQVFTWIRCAAARAGSAR